ncbi:MAG: helix-turn-helix domain-containing protein [Nitrososphaeria archaeon]
MSKISLPDSALIESELTGKTLLVYLYMLKSKGNTVGVREVQRKLGFSSPSVSIYHLDKLVSMGLVEKTVLGEYFIKKEVKVGVLKFYTRLGNLLLPRYLFYSTLFTAMLGYYLAFYGSLWTLDKVVAILFGSLASIFFWYETAKIWRERPF